MKKALTVLTLVLLFSVFGFAQNLATVITALGARESTLTIFKQYAVTDDLVIPANITLEFLQGGSVLVSDTKTLTINGHVEAGLYEIFEWAGTGKVVFDSSAVKKVYPQWWGAKADDVADDTGAIQATIDSVSATGGVVFFPPSAGHYMYSVEFEINFSNITIIGYGATLEALGGSATSSCFFVDGGSGAVPAITNIRFFGLTIDANKIGTGHIFTFGNVTDVTGEDLILLNASGSNIIIGEIHDGDKKPYRLNFKNVYCYNGGLNNVSIVGAEDVSFLNSHFIDAAGGPLNCGVDCEPNYDKDNRNISFKNCFAYGNEDFGIYVTPGGGTGRNYNIEIIGGEVYDSGSAGIFNNDNEGNTFLVQAVFVRANHGAGISTDMPNSRILDNKTFYNTSREIWFDTNAEFSIGKGNICIDGQGDGIECDALFCILKDNKVIGADSNGMFLTGNSAYCILSGNIVKDCTHVGFNHILVNGDNHTIEGNIVISSLGEGGAKGFYFDCTHARVFNNHAEGCKLASGRQYLNLDNPAYIDIAKNNWDGTLGGPIDFIISEVVTTNVALSLFLPTELDSNGGALTVTLGSGLYVGQVKAIVIIEASNLSTVSATLHETEDPEIGTFDAVNETWILMWTGTEWVTIKATCTFL